MNSCERKTILAYILVMNVECACRTIYTHIYSIPFLNVRFAPYAETNSAFNPFGSIADLGCPARFARSDRKAVSSSARGERASNEIIGDALARRPATHLSILGRFIKVRSNSPA